MTFNIIKQYGPAKQAKTLKGRHIERQEQLFFPPFETLIACAPYDDHFIYHDPGNIGSEFLCTCGSPAVVVPPNPKEGLFVCLFHATNGFHTTSVINKKDFGKQAGETIIIDPKGKQWL